jgi:hypothetical protein
VLAPGAVVLASDPGLIAAFELKPAPSGSPNFAGRRDAKRSRVSAGDGSAQRRIVDDPVAADSYAFSRIAGTVRNVRS